MNRVILLFFLTLIALQEVDGQQLRIGHNESYSSITQAVEAASPGDTLIIGSGVYREPTIYIDKPLTLLGINYPVLDGESSRQLVVIQADSVTVQGIAFENVGVSYVEDRSAIKVDDAHDCRIIDNRLSANFFGIYLAKSSGCQILHNDIRASGTTESGSGNGIHLWYSKDNFIAHNHISGHRDGIYLEFVEDTRVEDNMSTLNLRYGLHFMFSDRNSYRRNVFRDNHAGVAVMYTKNVIMDGNTFEDNWGTAAFGLLLKDITDSSVSNNTFHQNTIGVYVEGSDRINFDHNNFTRNGWAFKIMANSYDNQFRYNNLKGNTFDVSTNGRNTEVLLERNYWDEYKGYDLDKDGIGDVPFHPVRLFSLIVENNEPALFLLRSFFVSALDAAERVLPSLTPAMIVDPEPLMKPIVRNGSAQ